MFFKKRARQRKPDCHALFQHEQPPNITSAEELFSQVILFFPHLASILSPSRKYSFPISLLFSQAMLFFPHLAGNELWQLREVPHEPKLHMNFGSGARRLFRGLGRGGQTSPLCGSAVPRLASIDQAPAGRDPVCLVISRARLQSALSIIGRACARLCYRCLDSGPAAYL